MWYVTVKLYSWTLKFEFHIIFIDHEILSYFWFFPTIQQFKLYSQLMGFLGGASGKEPSCQHSRHKRHGFDPWVRKIPLRRKSSILAWRIPWTVEPGGLWSMGLQRVGHNWSDLAQHMGHYTIQAAVWNWDHTIVCCTLSKPLLQYPYK